MSGKHGIDINKPIGVCMVIGCNKKSLYRIKTNRSGRGYCSKHKDRCFTPSTQLADKLSETFLINHLKYKDEEYLE